MKEFPPFRLDAANECLWRGAERIALTPKAFSMLQYLVDRAGQLVTQKDLLDGLWDETFVQPEVLKSHIMDIRAALGDDAKSPLFIETQPRRGYRFIADVRESPEPAIVPANGAPAVEGVPERVKPHAPPMRRRWLVWIAAGILLAASSAGLALRWRDRAPIATAPIVQFEIFAPEHVLAPVGARFAVSPDGKRLVFWGRGQDGIAQLWLRNLDSLETRVLPGSQTNDTRLPPIWSPDSRFVAFNSDGKLKKIDASGGPAQALCDVPGGVIGGMMWTPDDQIVFGTGTAGVGIWRVPAIGGSPVAVTAADKSRQELLHGLPTLLPDGKHFLYVRVSLIPGKTGLYAGSLDAKPEQQSLRLIMPIKTGVVYVPSANGLGMVLYRDAGTILARRFDDRRMEFSGEPVRVAEMNRAESAWTGFSVGDGVLAYVSRASDKFQPTWIDRQGKAQGTIGEAGVYESFSLSPDAGRVVFSDSRDLWLLDTSEKKTTRLTFYTTGEFVSRAVWSPDGDRIAFGATVEHGDYLDIYEKTLAVPGDLHLVVKTTENKRPNDWSQDGNYLLFSHMRPDTRYDLWLLPEPGKTTDDGRAALFLSTSFNETEAKFSPDGRWVAYASDESGKSEIYVRRFGQHPDGVLQPGGGRLVSISGGVQVRWPRDGSELLYLTPDGKIMAVAVNTGPEFHAGTPQLVFQGPVKQNLWDVTADGKRLLVAVPVQSSQAPFTVVLNWQAALTK
jgi:eukaryotic-like serine/threonine-protein kinase